MTRKKEINRESTFLEIQLIFTVSLFSIVLTNAWMINEFMVFGENLLLGKNVQISVKIGSNNKFHKYLKRQFLKC